MKPLHPRTFRLDRLYNQFLKPRGIHIDNLPLLATKLYESQFIDLVYDQDNPDVERYSETQKLLSRNHRNELFKIIQGFRK